MPELPEVEYGRKVAESVARGRTIVELTCSADPIVFDGVSPASLRRKLLGCAVSAVVRRGKYIWFELDRRPWPVFHFGMTGAFRTPWETPVVLETSPKTIDTSWPPRFVKFHAVFDDGGELVMTNARRLGRIVLRQNPMTEPPISRLGFDPYESMPPVSEFYSKLARKRGTLKGLLLDQSFSAGVGNWIADEVLYQAKLDPRRKADSLTLGEIRRLHSRLRGVIKKAVELDARKDVFPKSWLFHHRWGKTKGAVTANGERILHSKVAGRTTAWVPTVQK